MYLEIAFAHWLPLLVSQRGLDETCHGNKLSFCILTLRVYLVV